MTREDTLLIVLAHGKVWPTCSRHHPLWERVAAEIEFVAPVDDPIPALVPQTLSGRSTRYGPENNVRVRAALYRAAFLRRPLTILVEYDAVFWRPIPAEALPPRGGLAAARFTEPREWAGIEFLGSQYFHFPILFDRAALLPLLVAIDSLPEDAEGGYADRLIGLAAEIEGLPFNDLLASGLAFTRDTIADSDVELAKRAVDAGAICSHGVKTAEVLERLLP